MIIDSPSPMSANKKGFTTSNLALLEKHLAGCLPHTFLLGTPLTTFLSAPAGILEDMVYDIQTTELNNTARGVVREIEEKIFRELEESVFVLNLGPRVLLGMPLLTVSRRLKVGDSAN